MPRGLSVLGAAVVAVAVLARNSPAGWAADVANAGCSGETCKIEGAQQRESTPTTRVSSGSGKQDECTYFRDQPINGGEGGYVIDPTKVDPSVFKKGDTVNVLCHTEDGNYYSFHAVWGPDGQPLPSGEQIARQALADVGFGAAQIESWPEPSKILIGVRTYFHVRNWAELERRAAVDTAPGTPDGVRASLVARPVATIWRLRTGSRGAEEVVRCDGAGTIWHRGLDDRDPMLCGATFWSKGTVTATVEVVYEASWSSNTGPGGVLYPPPQATPFAMTVHELQAVGQS